jgi:hypothetical protein
MPRGTALMAAFTASSPFDSPPRRSSSTRRTRKPRRMRDDLNREK